MSRRTAPRVLTVVALVTMVVSFVGFVAALPLNAFVFDDYDAYGEVPIPGSGSVHLPQGDVVISLHTLVIGGGSGGLPVPQMSIGIDPPDGVSDPVLTEDIGGTTTVNNDSRVRVWIAKIPADGTYDITTDGKVSAFFNPTLAFGHGSRYGYLPYLFGATFAVALVALLIARSWASRSGQISRPARVAEPTAPYVPTDQGVRLEQLNTLARLHDSGALTDAEFESEKKRVLDGL